MKMRFFLADKLVMMIDGKIEQVGPLKDILERPKNELIKRLLRPFEER